MRKTSRLNLPAPMSEAFIAHINLAVKKLNYGDRAKLIKDAVVEKLQREGIKTPQSLAAAPLRVGKRKGTPLCRSVNLALASGQADECHGNHPKFDWRFQWSRSLRVHFRRGLRVESVSPGLPLRQRPGHP